VASLVGSTVSHDKILGKSRPEFRSGRGSTFLPFLLLLFGLSAQTSGQIQNIAFERLSTEQGLVNSSVNCIFQDSRGFMWFGTLDGLCRYDGIRFAVFDSIGMGPESTIHEDRHGSLWIMSGKVHRFNIISEKISRYNVGVVGTEFRAWAYLEDASGDIWIGTRGNGLARYLRANDSFVTYTHDPENAASLCNDTVYAICEDTKGELWIGSGNGLFKFFPSFNIFRHPGNWIHQNRIHICS